MSTDDFQQDSDLTISWVSYVLHLVVAVGAVIPGGQVGPLLLVVALIIDLVTGQCITLAQLEAMAEDERLQALQPVECLLPGYAPVTLDGDNAARFLSGLRRRGHWPDQERVCVWGQSPRALLGTAHVKAGELIPGRLLSPIEIQQILERSPALAPVQAEQVERKKA